jgi:hypothetical protein
MTYETALEILVWLLLVTNALTFIVLRGIAKRSRTVRSQNPMDVAKLFHESYELLAPKFSYETREASAVPWDDVPINNKRLMIATAARVLVKLGIQTKGKENIDG